MKRGESGAASINAGYTYIGQLVSHDIVPETTQSRRGRLVTRHLNLDSLYGTPGNNSELFDKHGHFLIRPADDDHPDDFVRDPTGLAIIPDPRNDENVIVAQLHLFFLKLHNLIIDKGWASDPDDARRLVTLLFQLLVVEDFLWQILNRTVYESYVCKNQRWLPVDTLRIPREFSHAAFRFGHSMVREEYMGFGPGAGGKHLFELFRRSQRPTREFEIDWASFFSLKKLQPSQSALDIDTQITASMARIPRSGSRGQGTIDIIEQNLLAGKKAGLPSGHDYLEAVLSSPKGKQIAQAFALRPLDDFGNLRDRLPPDHRLDIRNLYLWPYLLLEAEEQRGPALGVLGSLIVAEVLCNAIEGAQDSVYKNGRYKLQEVLHRMSSLGEELRQIARKHKTETTSGCRRICMHHVMTLLDNQ